MFAGQTPPVWAGTKCVQIQVQTCVITARYHLSSFASIIFELVKTCAECEVAHVVLAHFSCQNPLNEHVNMCQTVRAHSVQRDVLHIQTVQVAR